MSSTDNKFWIKDPCILFSNPQIFPTQNMTKAEKLNALTRLAIVIAIGMYFLKYDNWMVFLLISLLVIILLYYSSNKSAASHKASAESKTEDFTIVPTYLGTDLQQTIVAPSFAEEWQIPPPAYDLYTSTSYPGQGMFEEPLQPQSYPYAQLLSVTNLLPSDEYYTRMGCGSARDARSYANSAFLRNDLVRRENMTRLYKKKLNRRFRQAGLNDTFSPYSGY